MTLVAPNLDDRRFQQLVDDAKRLVQRRCPEWTDHNVSDPGVTLIETFAWMTDLLLYRLNRVPDRHYVKFLDLLGVQLYPATAARVDVTFWLAGPTPDVVRIPIGTEVATPRSDDGGPMGFTTTAELRIVPCEMSHVASAPAGVDVRVQDATLAAGQAFFPFSDVPQLDDCLYVGLSEAVPSCAVTLRFDCDIEGIGVDPNDPPLRWEAYTAGGWRPCELERDTTGGLNRAGDVVVHVVGEHEVSVLDGARGGWLRARVVPGTSDRPQYSASPRIRTVRAFTIGGTVDAVNAEPVENEILGTSDGVAGQRFDLARGPIVTTHEPEVEVAEDDGWRPWQVVPTFAASRVDDRHVTLDTNTGSIVFGPAVSEPDGIVVQHGAVPRRGATVRVGRYLVGGGRAGNVAAGRISVLRSSIPFVQRVENRRAAGGGVDAETLDNAKVRGPMTLRARDRAVTLEDHEVLARAAAPEASRIHAVATDGGVRVLVVPSISLPPDHQIRFEDLVPDDDLLQRIAGHLDARRMIGARIAVEPARYQGITVVARVRARPRTVTDDVHAAALAALYQWFNPFLGGPDGTGWDFGRVIHVGDVFGVLQRVPGLAQVEDARLFAADPVTGERGQAVQRIDLDPDALCFSFEHRVLVEEA